MSTTPENAAIIAASLTAAHMSLAAKAVGDPGRHAEISAAVIRQFRFYLAKVEDGTITHDGAPI